MDSIIDVVIDMAVFLAVVAVALFVRSRMADQQQRALRETATALGLQFEAQHMGSAVGAEPSAAQQALAQSGAGAALLGLFSRLPMSRSWRLHGRRGGVAIHISPDAHCHGTPMTRLRADYAAPLGFALELQSRAELDSAAAASWLADPDVRRALLDLFDAHSAAQVDARGAQIRLHGRVSDAATLRPLVDALVRAAQAIDAAGVRR